MPKRKKASARTARAKRHKKYLKETIHSQTEVSAADFNANSSDVGYLSAHGSDPEAFSGSETHEHDLYEMPSMKKCQAHYAWRRKNNSLYKEQQNRLSQRHYLRNDAYRTRKKDAVVHKYANDVEYNTKQKQTSVKKYGQDEVHRT